MQGLTKEEQPQDLVSSPVPVRRPSGQKAQCSSDPHSPARKDTGAGNHHPSSSLAEQVHQHHHPLIFPLQKKKFPFTGHHRCSFVASGRTFHAIWQHWQVAMASNEDGSGSVANRATTAFSSSTPHSGRASARLNDPLRHHRLGGVRRGSGIRGNTCATPVPSPSRTLLLRNTFSDGNEICPPPQQREGGE